MIIDYPPYLYTDEEDDLMPSHQLNTQAVLMPGFDGTALPEWVRRRLSEGMGGVCLFKDNIESPEQLAALTTAIYEANPHAVIAIDEEGGDVTRLYHREGAPFPGNAVLGRLADPGLTARIGEQVGHELARVGISLTLAPDADVNSNPSNPVIGVRAFGNDPDEVAEHTAAWVAGVQSTGVAACAKHFPGHGATEEDSHVALPVVGISEQELRGRELVPFRAAIRAGVKAIMTAHIMVPEIDPRYPATLSEVFLQRILREELRFDGVIISDALDMAGVSGTRGISQAAALALAAGCDLLCIGAGNTDKQVGEIAESIAFGVGGGRLSHDRMADAIARVQGMGAALAAERSQHVPSESRRGPGVPPEQVAGSFSLQGRAAELIDQHRAGRPVVWLQIDPMVNAAIGETPWGPFTEGGIVPAVRLGPRDNPALVREVLPGGAIAIVVGRDNHRHAWVCELIDTLRQEVDTIVVDMGWPQPDRGYADIATYGASRLVGEALIGAVG